MVRTMGIFGGIAVGMVHSMENGICPWGEV